MGKDKDLCVMEQSDFDPWKSHVGTIETSTNECTDHHPFTEEGTTDDMRPSQSLDYITTFMG